MSTAGSVSPKQTVGGGFMLPAPVVRAGGPVGVYQSSKGPPQSSNVFDVYVNNPVSVSVHGLPRAIMDDLAAYKPQLELMRYVGRRSNTGQMGRNLNNAGYVHPSHGPAPSGNGSHTHGGQQTHVPPAVQAIRPTEWAVTGHGQVIDATQGMTGHMCLLEVLYRQATIGPQSIGTFAVMCPSYRTHTGMAPGRRFGYANNFKPGYFKFRWSIIDPTDSRGQRISGPLSDTVALTNDKFPFAPDTPWVDPFGGDAHATAVPIPGFDVQQMRAWIGTSRLPR